MLLSRKVSSIQSTVSAHNAKRLSLFSTPSSKSQLRKFEKLLRVRFKQKSLLDLALSHRSVVNSSCLPNTNNERLEFLGDAVLGLVVSDYLYKILPSENEGRLARIKSVVVSEDSLAEIALSLSIDTIIRIGKGEEKSGGRLKKAILADALEAVIGACFLDAGFKRAKDFVLRILIPEINKVVENRHKRDYKTLLQERLQKEYKVFPRYKLVKETGPNHFRTFWIEVQCNDKVFGPGKGNSKKEAEKQAAAIAYSSLFPE